jgi:hypothetical protein
MRKASPPPPWTRRGIRQFAVGRGYARIFLASRPTRCLSAQGPDHPLRQGSRIHRGRRHRRVFPTRYAEKGRALVERGWKLFNRLEAVKYPTLALVRGHCLGGGLELALACRYLLAVDESGTKMGLPEVMLGIFPAGAACCACPSGSARPPRWT